MGGHVAEKLVIGNEKISSGCSSDLQGATNLAVQAVRQSGMFGDLASYVSSDFDESSDQYNAKVDRAVKQILDVSATAHAYTAIKKQFYHKLYYHCACLCRNHSIA